MQNLGTQLWDSAFYVQAIIASNLTDEYENTLRRAHEFIKQTQVRLHLPNDQWNTILLDHSVVSFM